MNNGRILIVRASLLISTDEYAEVQSSLESLNFEVVVIDHKLHTPLVQTNGCFDYIFIASHGTPTQIGINSDVGEDYSSLANWLCTSNNCFTPGATLFLACCHGGAFEVASTILASCSGKIQFVVGAAEEVKAVDLDLARRVFFRNRAIESESICQSVDKIAGAGIVGFECRDFLNMSQLNV
jgi:hypothetical protein